MDFLTKLLARFVQSLRYEYRGSVHGSQVIVDDTGNKLPGRESRQEFFLFENGLGHRYYQVTGGNLNSPHAINVRAQVKAWKAGGPLPTQASAAPAPKPPKKKEPQAKEGAVLKLVGKNQDAA